MSSDRQISRRCPACGRGLTFSPGDLPLLAGAESAGAGPGSPGSDPAGVSRVLRALCGCYVFEMPDAAVGRLLASVLAYDVPDTEERDRR